MVTDPIGDLLTRLRNAGMARHFELSMPSSRTRASVVAVLKDEGRFGDAGCQPAVLRRWAVCAREITGWARTSPHSTLECSGTQRKADILVLRNR